LGLSPLLKPPERRLQPGLAAPRRVSKLGYNPVEGV
jgi:hypothetical protein